MAHPTIQKAISELQAKYPALFEKGLLSEATFRSVQYDVDDQILKSDAQIRRAVVQEANSHLRRFGRVSAPVTL